MTTDAELLALIGRAPRPQQEAKAASLPALDMTMLLSASAQREVQAVLGISQRSFQIPAAQMQSVPLERLSNFTEDIYKSLYERHNNEVDSRVVEMLSKEFEPSVDVHSVPLESLWDTESTEDYLEEGPSRPAVEIGLESLFMTGEALDALQARGGGGFSSPQPARTPMPEFGISFEDVEVQEGPRPTGSMRPYRFQLGRENPPPGARPMGSRQASLGGQDGVVVSQRGPQGFRSTREAEPSGSRATIQRAEVYSPSSPSTPPAPAGPGLSRFAWLGND
jgi:hypothetical protein